MENEPEKPPRRRRPISIAFLIAALGLFLVNASASMLLKQHGMLGWMLLASGIVIILLAMLWGTNRV